MTGQQSTYIVMIKEDGKILLFHLNNDAPSDAINQLKTLLISFGFIDGFYLDEQIHEQIISDFKSDWDMFNRSLQGICYHPRFPEIWEDMKRNSNFIYTNIKWVHIGWKTDLSSVSTYKNYLKSYKIN